MNKIGEFCGLSVFYANGNCPWKAIQRMTREEQLQAIRSRLDSTRTQEYTEWEAAETGISELPSAENRQRAIILRVRIVEIIKVAKSIGFTQEELS